MYEPQPTPPAISTPPEVLAAEGAAARSAREASMSAVVEEADRVALRALLGGARLTRETSAALFTQIVGGELSHIEIGAALTALKIRGETVDEIIGAATALKQNAIPFDRPDYLFADTCGTGGDAAGTVNISTAAAFVAVAAGLPVAKHGNRSISSKCGSLDVLAAAGAHIDMDPSVARRCLDETGFCVLPAPQYHVGVRHAMPVRKVLATPTIFNILGPLANPAQPGVQLVGVYDPALCGPLAYALRELGARSACVVHGSGLDEVAIHGPTTVARLKGGTIDRFTLDPADAGLPTGDLAALAGGGPTENAALFSEILLGRGNASQRNAVAANAGLLLATAEICTGYGDGVALALEILAKGQAFDAFRKFVEFSHDVR